MAFIVRYSTSLTFLLLILLLNACSNAQLDWSMPSGPLTVVESPILPEHIFTITSSTAVVELVWDEVHADETASFNLSSLSDGAGFFSAFIGGSSVQFGGVSELRSFALNENFHSDFFSGSLDSAQLLLIDLQVRTRDDPIATGSFLLNFEATETLEPCEGSKVRRVRLIFPTNFYPLIEESYQTWSSLPPDQKMNTYHTWLPTAPQAPALRDLRGSITQECKPVAVVKPAIPPEHVFTLSTSNVLADIIWDEGQAWDLATLILNSAAYGTRESKTLTNIGSGYARFGDVGDAHSRQLDLGIEPQFFSGVLEAARIEFINLRWDSVGDFSSGTFFVNFEAPHPLQPCQDTEVRRVRLTFPPDYSKELLALHQDWDSSGRSRDSFHDWLFFEAPSEAQKFRDLKGTLSQECIVR